MGVPSGPDGIKTYPGHSGFNTTSYPKRQTMITEGLIIACIISAALSLLAYKMHSLPIIFISSLGWVISGLQIFQQTDEILPTLLIMMLAVSQFMLIHKEGA